MSGARRNTWQREAVRAALAEARGFVSAQELHQRLREQGSTIGLATVYRALSGLTESGEADSVQAPEGENLFRSCAMEGHHHHLICRSCGDTRELAAEAVETWSRQVAAEYGFAEIEHVVDLFGVCESCRAARG
ncbi:MULTISPECIES: Fur family transcriptional regulator [unclassified Leucobacter]|uniref:Fur family transcriptional regulator n=1 Tax=unclassified Leucobacter TaxID=2621730 RepID=UPI00165E71A7|nr:transcriptional repressor [Leucobacter sp. CX169]MBC9927035.1 transcriptional repressor [Leucobacter sp. cx-169]MBC9936314.1 transcriptional repressor [Leucobacter sp. cx-87]